LITERITEITASDWKVRPINLLCGSLRKLRRTLAKSAIPEKRLLEKELGMLLKGHKGFHIHLTPDKTPVLGGVIASLRIIDEETIINTVSKVGAVKYLSSMDIDSLIWQAKYCVITEAVNNPAHDSDSAYKLGALTDLDPRTLCKALNPLEMLYSGDELYPALTGETRAGYRRMTSEVAVATGIDEARLSREYMKRRSDAAPDKHAHIGEIITKDYRRVFPFVRVGSYLLSLFLVSALLAAVFGYFTMWWASALVYVPCLAIIKPLLDYIAIKSTRGASFVPRLSLKGSVPPEARTLCVISTLITSEKDIAAGLDKLKCAKLKNNSENIKFALLCDLKPAKTEATPDDAKLLAAAQGVFTGMNGDYIMLVRERKYCKTQRLWQGEERKRGAILALCRLLRDNDERKHGFKAVYGSRECLHGMKYILALDYDTVPLMDSISELVSIALHPLHKDIGIIAPRITTSLDSYLKTGFSRAMSGNGGCAGASSYDSFSGEMYQDCFGEGIFTGKGLININSFLETCGDHKRFKPERILSHDILEGGCTGVVYAGDVEFSDGFPDTSAAYFKRQHRWLRGDLQNFGYIFFRRTAVPDSPCGGSFSALTRWKLSDNVRRAVTPLFAFACFVVSAVFNMQLIALAGLLAITMPFLTGFIPSVMRGRRFAFYRRFYSPVITQTAQLLRQCLLEIMYAPKSALVSSDALLRTVWRMLVTKRRLLDWTTSSAFEGMKTGFSHILLAAILSAGLLMLAVIGDNALVFALCVIFLAALPFTLYIDRARGSASLKISKTMRRELEENARKMWSFYEDYVTAEHNHLPPDNVQYSPVYRVSARTSPTNIGMYLLSCAVANISGFIGKAGFEKRVSDTMTTLEKLPKWHGNLMNWYETIGLNIISPFVSSVDSGNFVCCLVALKEALRDVDADPHLISRVEDLARKTDLRPFFNNARELFSIGFDVDSGELSRHNYDLIMSEARMLSYYAIATGQAGKRHWRSLGRVMGRSGRYAAPVAWTGTMFEYYMPELLLGSKEGSMEYEALRFSLHCQQKRGRETGLPFGMSESGYYAFDEALNYQYKAHGVQTVGLKGGLNKERVISPYSSFLSLGTDPIASYNNLARLEKLGASHSKYGFYEAVDFTKHRVGSGYAVVKSHMAHHVGMSLAGVCNTLHDGKLQKLFLADPDMKRAEELLEEKIMAGEPVLATPEWQEEQTYRINSTEFTRFSLTKPQVNPLSNGLITALTSDSGISLTYYNKKSAFYKTDDLYNPRGALFAFCENEHEMPFLIHPHTQTTPEKSVIFFQNSTEYYLNHRNLQLGQQVYLHPCKAVELRRFAAENLSGMKRQLTLAIYLEPALARFRDVAAHPAFMDLFLKLRFDEEQKLIIVKRKERIGESETVMAVGFREENDFTFSFNREDIVERGGGMLSALKKACDREINTTSVPCPCVFVKADFPLDAFGKREAELFFCFGESEQEVMTLAAGIRSGEAEKPSEEIISPLVRETMYGRFTARILPHILYSPLINRNAVLKNNLDKRALWRLGVSGDYPVVLFDFIGCRDAQSASGANAIIEMKKALHLCGVEFDLVFLCENEAQRNLAEQLKREICTEAFVIGKWSVEPDLLNLLRAVACYTQSSDELAPPANKTKTKEPDFLPLLRSEKPDNCPAENRFENETYIIEDNPGVPWSNVLASSRFGTLVSDRSLGFSWALNSRENKLTPWNNDLRADNKGELLVMHTGDALYDLIDGSRAVFAPNRAEYHGVVRGINARTTVAVYEKGMGKEVTLELENRSKKTQSFFVAYYAEPVLGVTREYQNTALIKPEVSDDTLIFKNSSGVFSGAMLMYADTDKKCVYLTDRRRFFEGAWSGVSTPPTPAHDIIGAVIIKIELPPKHNDKIKFILAFTKNLANPLPMKGALVGRFPAPLIDAGQIRTGDPRLDALYRYWLPWQAIGGRMWARTGFYQNSGAFGYRDQLQDCLPALHIRPELAKRHIFRACAVQFAEGDVLHWWHDMETHNKGVRTRYSDDLLWLPYVTAEYVRVTKDYDLLDTRVPYCEGESLCAHEHEKYIEVSPSAVKESVYLHCKRALEKAYAKGGHELLLMGSGDWCDGYNNVGAEGRGESVWVSMFYAMVCKMFAETALMMGDPEYADLLNSRRDGLLKAVDAFAWDGEYYLRAFYDNGREMGGHRNEHCRIDLLPQAFATLAGLPDEQRRQAALESAEEHLCDMRNKIIKLFTPPFSHGNSWQTPGYVESYPEGVRENGGQYTHAAMWLALAFLKAGDRNKAETLTRMLAPFGRGDEYKTEPYYVSADIYTNPQAYGRGGWSLYTGSAGWYFWVLREVFGGD
jgi:cyclic beta-1,2-glucan synthetase